MTTHAQSCRSRRKEAHSKPPSRPSRPPVRCSASDEGGSRDTKPTPEQRQRWNSTFYQRHKAQEYQRTLAYDLSHRRAKRARQRRAARRMRESLSDGYVRWRLSRGTTVKMSAWPAALVALKRAQLQLLRLCQNHKTSAS
jgi:hypothetical protein